MSAYRDNAFKPPSAPPEPKLTWGARIGEWLWVKLVQPLLCQQGYHRLHRHTRALGWCKHCKRALRFKHAGAEMMWHEVSVEEWERMHDLSVAAGLDRRCAERVKHGVN